MDIHVLLLLGGCFQYTFQIAQTRHSSKRFSHELIDCCVPRDAGRKLFCVLDNFLCRGHVSRNGLLFRPNISHWAKMNSLLFLVSLRDFVRSQAKIVAFVRKTFGTTIKLHLGVGSEFFFSRKVTSHRCTPGQN